MQVCQNLLQWIETTCVVAHFHYSCNLCCWLATVLAISVHGSHRLLYMYVFTHTIFWPWGAYNPLSYTFFFFFSLSLLFPTSLFTYFVPKIILVYLYNHTHVYTIHVICTCVHMYVVQLKPPQEVSRLRACYYCTLLWYCTHAISTSHPIPSVSSSLF